MKRYELRTTKKGNGGEMLPNRCGGWVTHADAQAAVLAEREACASAVPTNWCDPLLTGPQATMPSPGRSPTFKDVENLLRQVQARIRAL